MGRPAPIRLDADTWAIMREATEHPTAIIHRVTDMHGTARFLVMKWHMNPANQRMTGIYPTLEQADNSVLYDLAKVNAAVAKNSGPPNGGGPLHNLP